jgi:hypothetical protein
LRDIGSRLLRKLFETKWRLLTNEEVYAMVKNPHNNRDNKGT